MKNIQNEGRDWLRQGRPALLRYVLLKSMTESVLDEIGIEPSFGPCTPGAAPTSIVLAIATVTSHCFELSASTGAIRRLVAILR